MSTRPVSPCASIFAASRPSMNSDWSEDVVIRPEPEHQPGLTTWLLSREHSANGTTVAKMRITRERSMKDVSLSVHPGREWFTVLSGTVSLVLGERTILVHPGQASKFSTMVPHRIGAHDGPVEILTIFDHGGKKAYLHGAHPGHEH
ncbi:cupin domain-containing protein [Arthrobacter sp. MYb227]|uniref:cupin domain-containing protein n=1 Tax=Arthrobacter sp. MYb227 TaxID=1848601 RepID=UPI0021576CFA|nr:cupin domain-containing protein [Arthrobacter sp. MYb227]